MPIWSYIIVAVAAYLLGSIPTGYLVAKARGIDIQKTGSGNIGATNAMRVLGKPAGVFVLLMDCSKGFFAVRLLPILIGNADELFFGDNYKGAGGLDLNTLEIFAGIFAVLGHNYTCWLKFKGGKGIATTAGVYLALAPIALGIALAVFILVILITRYVSVGAIIGAIVLPVAVWFTNEDSLLRMVTIALGALAIFKHRKNMQRLLAGTENRIGKKTACEDARLTDQKKSEAAK